MLGRGEEVGRCFESSRTLPIQYEGQYQGLQRTSPILLGNLADELQLNSIDNMRVDGKFYVGKDIPEGQGSVIGLLSECYDLCYDLRTAAEEDEDETE